MKMTEKVKGLEAMKALQDENDIKMVEKKHKMATLKAKLNDQRRERLNRETEELEERMKPSPTYFPYTKNKGKHSITRFEAPDE